MKIFYCARAMASKYRATSLYTNFSLCHSTCRISNKGVLQQQLHTPRYRQLSSNGALTNSNLLTTPAKTSLMTQNRTIASLAARAVGRLLRVRYLLFGSIVGGGAVVGKKYEDWKDSLPDMSWLKELYPDQNVISEYKEKIQRLASGIQLPEKGWSRLLYGKLEEWKDQYSAAWDSFTDKDELSRLLAEGVGGGDCVNLVADGQQSSVSSNLLGFGKSSADTQDEAADRPQTDAERLRQVQDEIMKIQIRYQKEIERLEQENKELRKQQLLLRNSSSSASATRRRRANRALIDMYSEALDELAGYDSSYNTQDHLPRVVVVGDQSSGKTSVLEMVAQARIFPRGSGEMMTRAPVKVTLSEGPYHVARFKDSGREYDLTQESELEALRREVEVRMKASVKDGKTVSNECIAMSVSGPGLQRMVLVDLPGIISTMTAGMAADTRDSIRCMCQSYMENPNAIILCIQDGSLDAERSNVTDMVSQMDPKGRRTIFVLTKVDLAESGLVSPGRIQEILEGRLFPMRALGYFAVVTGRGNTNDTIKEIKDYEEQFFKNSKLFRSGSLKPSQTTTANLSLAVSQCFWKMVHKSVEQQADAFKATRFNLETEWKNTFPRTRELDRDELFEKARGEILDEVLNLGHVTAQQWEDIFQKKLWEGMSQYFFDQVYLPASQSSSSGHFNTQVDIKLKQWAESQLPKLCVEVGYEALREQFTQLLERSRARKDYDPVYEPLRTAVQERSIGKHRWDAKAELSLRVIQQNALEDRVVPDKRQWDEALGFMDASLKAEMGKVSADITEGTGPGAAQRWLQWKSLTGEQRQRAATLHELQKLVDTAHGKASRSPTLASDELTTVKKNLETQGVDVSEDFIRSSWDLVHRRQFVTRSQKNYSDCRRAFYLYQKGFLEQSGLQCFDVVLFWRMQRMIQITANALRQQVVNTEVNRLEKEIKETLDELSEDSAAKLRLLNSRRVTLAEELKQVRRIQELLEEFIDSLNKEKS